MGGSGGICADRTMVGRRDRSVIDLTHHGPLTRSGPLKPGEMGPGTGANGRAYRQRFPPAGRAPARTAADSLMYSPRLVFP